MGNHNNNAQILLLILLNLGTLLITLACPECHYPTPTPPTKPPNLPPHLPPKHPPVTKPPPPVVKPPPYVPKPPPYKPKPPVVEPPITPKPPIIYPPTIPKPPIIYPPVIPNPPLIHPPVLPNPPIVYPPIIPKPPIIYPPIIPKPPVVPKPPTVKPPPQETPCPPPPPPPPKKAPETCPIDTLKLVACVDVLGGLVHVGIGGSPKNACCPVLEGLVDLDAALCLCTAIKAKLLTINVLVPIAVQVLVDCGKYPPSGFKCPA